VPKSAEWEKSISPPSMIYVDPLLYSMNGDTLRDTYFGEYGGFFVLEGCSSHPINPILVSNLKVLVFLDKSVSREIGGDIVFWRSQKLLEIMPLCRWGKIPLLKKQFQFHP
jgi:hypothetical protein